MTKAIFWDNDGVLVETEHLYFRASAQVLSQVDVELDKETFIELSLRKGKSALEPARDKGLTDSHMEELRLERNEIYASLLHTDARAIEGVEKTLDRLKGKVLMAIVTSSLKEHFEIIHNSTGLLDYFDFILTREDYGLSKPHPEPYLTALKKSGLQAEQCVVVEDSQRGLQSAAAAGLRCMVIPGELNSQSDFSQATQILQKIDQIPEALGL